MFGADDAYRNQRLGWTLLVVGLAGGAFLDPWSLSEREPAQLVGSTRMALRHAQAVVVGMGILQLGVGQLLQRFAWKAATRRTGSVLTAIGAVVYSAGYLLVAGWSAAGWVIVAGAAINLLGFMVLARDGFSQHRRIVPIVLLTFCVGMAIDATMGLFAADPQSLHPAYLGAEDGVRLRMLRLARAAVIALSILTILYDELASRPNGQSSPTLAVWGGRALLLGAVLMPLVLCVAAFTSVTVKYLLPVPAEATFLGALAGVWLARRAARPLERWGWILISVSMGVGLLMGGYAFDGPLPSPSLIGEYNDYGRRLLRLGHAYAIVVGMVGIFLARRLESARPLGRIGKAGVPVFLGGSLTLLVGLFLAAVMPLQILHVGPGLVAAGMLLCLLASRRMSGGQVH